MMWPDCMRLYDAHNHLQDARFGGRQTTLVREAGSVGVTAMVVNGTSPADWDVVAHLSETLPGPLPAFGLHPWFVRERPPDWLGRLRSLLDRYPHASIGEIGLDRGKRGLSYEDQEDVFLAQWRLAGDLNRAASLHGLKSWGRLLELVRDNPAPARGFLLHSYGGPRELIKPFAACGAFFSFPGYYLHPRKEKQREIFRFVPADRLLLETDAPDQLPPDDRITHALCDATGLPVHHPANLAAVHAGLAEILRENPENLATRLEANFRALFG